LQLIRDRVLYTYNNGTPLPNKDIIDGKILLFDLVKYYYTKEPKRDSGFRVYPGFFNNKLYGMICFSDKSSEPKNEKEFFLLDNLINLTTPLPLGTAKDYLRDYFVNIYVDGGNNPNDGPYKKARYYHWSDLLEYFESYEINIYNPVHTNAYFLKIEIGCISEVVSDYLAIKYPRQARRANRRDKPLYHVGFTTMLTLCDKHNTLKDTTEEVGHPCRPNCGSL
jgi:hypothetical protein